MADLTNPSPVPNNDSGSTPATATSQSDVIARPVAPRRALDKIPRQFGRYRIEETLGRGGMGAVFKAQDTQLDRLVALKIPFLGDDDADTRQRFYREARAAATLQHANICPVFDVGEFDGMPYITMAFIDGRSLNQAVLAGQSFSWSQIALLARKLALAMQEAHAHGVIHRDLKPANVLLRPNGEPVIMDFGLARRDDDKRSHGLTQEGDILGTLDYMSPEQAEAVHENIGPPADVYALGVILYELLCGQRPFKGSTASMLVQIMTKEPQRPGEIKPGVPARLEQICLKAMAKKPEDRLPSMGAFVAALTEFLRGLQSNPAMMTRPAAPATPTVPVEAPPTPRPSETQPIAKPTAREPKSAPKSSPKSGPKSGRPRSGKRRKAKKSSAMPMVLLGVGGGALALILIVVLAIVLWPSRDKSTAQTPPPGPSSPPPGAAPIRPIAPAGKPSVAANPGPPKPKTTPGFAIQTQPMAVSLQVGQAQKVTLKLDRKDYAGPVTLKWTAPGGLLVAPANQVTVPANQSEAVLTLRVMAEPPTSDLPLELTATHDQEAAREVVTARLAVNVPPGGPCVRVIEMPLKPDFAVNAVAFTPDLAVALIGGGSGPPPAPRPGTQPGAPPPPDNGEANALQVFNLQRGEVIATLAGHKDRVHSVILSADGKSALSTSADETVAVWDVAQGKKKLQSPKQLARVLMAAMSPDAGRGLVIYPGAALKVKLDTLTALGTPLNTLPMFGKDQADAVRTVAYSSEKKALIGGLEGKLFLLDLPDRGKAAAPKALVGHDEAVLCAAFDSEGRYAATGGGGTLTAGTLQPGKDTAVRVWDVAAATLKWKATGHTDSVVSVAFSPDGKLLASASADGTVKVWKADDGAPVATLTGHAGKVLGLGFSADGKTLWSGGADRTLRQWRMP